MGRVRVSLADVGANPQPFRVPETTAATKSRRSAECAPLQSPHTGRERAREGGCRGRPTNKSCCSGVLHGNYIGSWLMGQVLQNPSVNPPESTRSSDTKTAHPQNSTSQRPRAQGGLYSVPCAPCIYPPPSLRNSTVFVSRAGIADRSSTGEGGEGSQEDGWGM